VTNSESRANGRSTLRRNTRAAISRATDRGTEVGPRGRQADYRQTFKSAFENTRRGLSMARVGSSAAQFNPHDKASADKLDQASRASPDGFLSNPLKSTAATTPPNEASDNEYSEVAGRWLPVPRRVHRSVLRFRQFPLRNILRPPRQWRAPLAQNPQAGGPVAPREFARWHIRHPLQCRV